MKYRYFILLFVIFLIPTGVSADGFGVNLSCEDSVASGETITCSITKAPFAEELSGFSANVTLDESFAIDTSSCVAGENLTCGIENNVITITGILTDNIATFRVTAGSVVGNDKVIGLTSITSTRAGELVNAADVNELVNVTSSSLSNDATLASLSLSTVNGDPINFKIASFSGLEMNWQAIGVDVCTVKVHATPNHANATFLDDFTTGKEFNVVTGENNIYVKVKSEDGNITNTYTINVVVTNSSCAGSTPVVDEPVVDNPVEPVEPTPEDVIDNTFSDVQTTVSDNPQTSDFPIILVIVFGFGGLGCGLYWYREKYLKATEENI
ncbi:MAG: cadherin-like beta sandwich domain-containing protein [bacterium]|nr:cadherin-like beta sandwich domain-containing protein [bacterium]